MLLSAEHLSINFGSRQLLDYVNFYLNEGDKTGIIGINGTGKSTFLKVLAGLTEPDAGTISRNPNVQVSFLSQNPAMQDDATVLEQVFLHFPAEFRELNEYEAKTMLNRLGLSDFTQKVGTLSGGQRKRVALAAALIHPADVLILDEPTNHLDIQSREWIEEAVEAYDGTLLFVSHDRYFINRFATRIWELTDGTITDYPCGFAQYRQMKAQEEAEKAAAPKPEKEREKPAAERPQRGNKAQQAARRQLTICERDIARAEEYIAALEADMEAAACDYEKLNELVGQKDAAQAELDALYERWEQLSEEAEG